MGYAIFLSLGKEVSIGSLAHKIADSSLSKSQAVSEAQQQGSNALNGEYLEECDLEPQQMEDRLLVATLCPQGMGDCGQELDYKII